jgi:hypothetical protein
VLEDELLLVLVSSTMEYLSNERTFPEICVPFSNWTVMCFPPAKRH